MITLMIITSSQNPKIQAVRALMTQSKARRKGDVFVVEGIRLAEEALASGWQPEQVLFTNPLSERGRTVIEAFTRTGCDMIELSPPLMQSLADTESTQGLLAVFPARRLPVPEHLDFVLVVDSLRDPGNLGTLMRTCLAAGVQLMILAPGTVEAFSPKVVRAGMGAHFKLPIIDLSWPEIANFLRNRPEPLEIQLAEMSSGKPLWEVDFRSPLALVIGGEADGASIDARQVTSSFVHIPMLGSSESLNAAVAAAVLIFEVVRQRQK